jgi:hypothetical protein
MIAAKESKHLSIFKNEYELSKHEIFKIFPLKPQGIVQLALLLEHKSLDTIKNE